MTKNISMSFVEFEEIINSAISFSDLISMCIKAENINNPEYQKYMKEASELFNLSMVKIKNKIGENK